MPWATLPEVIKLQTYGHIYETTSGIGGTDQEITPTVTTLFSE